MAIHQPTKIRLVDLHIPQYNSKAFEDDISCKSTEYLTYIILNKRKLDKRQAPIIALG